MIRRILLVFLCSLFFQKILRAQDPIFSQHYFVQETMNPAFIGFTETTYAGIIHRTQWPSLALRLDSDYAFINTWFDSKNSGVGFSVFNQSESFTNYNFSQLNVSYAHGVQINRDWQLRLAIEAGLGFKTFSFQKLVFSDQIDVYSGVILPNSIDPLALNERLVYPDFSAGLLVNNEKYWFGLAIKHLNKPNISFSKNQDLPLQMFYNVNAGGRFFIADYLYVPFLPLDAKILFSTNFMRQGAFNRLDLSTTVIFEKLFLGLTAATNPFSKTSEGNILTSINPFVGMQINQLKFGISYDYNTTKIGPTGGIYELSLTYKFGLNNKCFYCALNARD